MVAAGPSPELLADLLSAAGNLELDEMTRAGAISVLGSLYPGTPEVTAVCISGLSDPRPRVRSASTHTLAASGPEAVSAVPALIDALQNGSSPDERKALAEALRSISGVDLGQDVPKWRKWWKRR
jgi:HEAT repeat protein